MISIFRKIPKFDVLKDIGIYFSANLYKAGLPFLILPILTLYLSPEQYGIWNIYLAIMAFVLPLTACGLPTIIARNYHKYDQDEHAKMVFTSLTCIAGFSLVVLGLIAIYGLFHDEFMNIPVVWLMALPLLALTQNIQYFNKIILAHDNRAKFYAILDMFNVTTLRVGGLLAVMFISASWLSMLQANIIVQSAFACLAAWFLLRDNRLTPSWEWSRAKSLLSMGWPVIGHTIGAIVMTLSDRLILEEMTTTADVGIYSLGANLGAGAFIFCTAFNQKFGPWLYRQLKSPTDKTKVKIVRYTYLYFILTWMLAGVVAIAGYFYITYLINESYAGATAFLIWIAAGSAFHGMQLVIGHYVTIEGRTKMLPLVTGLAAILNIILTIYLIDKNGPIGAAQATFFAYAFSFAFMWWMNHRTYPMPWFGALRLK